MTGKTIAAALLAAGLLVAASPLPAQESEAATSPRRCGQRTIQGRYGYYGQGETLPNDFGVPAGPWVSLGTATFDGEGSFAWTSSDLPGVLTGTYVLRRDCTGTATFNFPDPLPPASGNMIVVDGGNELFIAPPAGSITVGVFIYKRR
jgi:hypothetical protein